MHDFGTTKRWRYNRTGKSKQYGTGAELKEICRGYDNLFIQPPLVPFYAGKKPIYMYTLCVYTSL